MISWGYWLCRKIVIALSVSRRCCCRCCLMLCVRVIDIGHFIVSVNAGANVSVNDALFIVTVIMSDMKNQLSFFTSVMAIFIMQKINFQ